MAFKFELGEYVKTKRGMVYGPISGRTEYTMYPSSYLVEWVDEKHEPRETWIPEHDLLLRGAN